MDAVEFVRREVLPKLGEITPLVDTLALHPTCSSPQIGLNPALEAVAATVARKVDVPLNWGCCGFAGDRGMLHPELTASAAAPEAREVKEMHADAHASCNRTCEVGMTRATGSEYRHVLELLEEATRPGRPAPAHV
ncbi:MAG: (Fe-S)-binding protein [Actinomyces sp.]|nr:(Fe-S)-binding protein [Actinomyces sp.]